LKFLYLSNNGLRELPHSLHKLRNLIYINISYNNFTALPESISALANLVELRIYDNSLVTLPDSLGNLVKLEELQAENNQLKTLPESSLPPYLSSLPHLEKLDVRLNKQLKAPAWFRDLEKRGRSVFY